MSLKIENLYKSFVPGKNILENITLDIENGEFVCLLGPSGCGKSTLLNIIAGLDTPTKGQVTLDGKPVVKPGTDRSYIFQEPALFPWLNVIDNVKFGMRINGAQKKEQTQKAAHYLDMVKLSGYDNYRIHELSGGMKQRVSLARALTLDSQVLLMDEPFSALDNNTKNELREYLSDIWVETKKTILFVTHSIKEAFILADRIILFSADPATIMKEYRPRGKTPDEVLVMKQEIEDIFAGEVVDFAS